MEEYYVMELRQRGVGLTRRECSSFPDKEDIKDFLREFGGGDCTVRVFKEYRLLPFA